MPSLRPRPRTAIEDDPPSTESGAPDRITDGAIEITIAWGTTVLRVVHLDPPRSFRVGSADDGSCDFVLEAPELAAGPIAIVEVDGELVQVAAPPDADGEIALDGEPPRALREVGSIAFGGAARDGSASCTAPLPPGAAARVAIGGLTFFIRRTPDLPRQFTHRALFDVESFSYVGLSLAAHAGILAALASVAPPLGLSLSEDELRDQTYLMSQYLEAAAERDREVESSESADKSGEDRAAAAPDDRRPIAAPRAPARAGGSSREGGDRTLANGAAPMTRAEERAEAAQFGLISLLGSEAGGQPPSSSSVWQDAAANASDPAALAKGLGLGEGPGWELTGVGQIGGGPGRGVDIGGIETPCADGDIARCEGGGGLDEGHGRGLARGSHQAHPPVIHYGQTIVSGRIPPEVIQRVVRQNYGRFRLCYEQGLRSNPRLAGRVAVKFVIGRDGAVSQAFDGGSDLADRSVVSCIVGAYYGLTFPAPDSGIVTVTYPILFTAEGE